MTASTLLERLFPGMTPAALRADVDTTHVAHGPLTRLPELEFIRACGSVEGWLRLVVERGRREFTVKNVTWTHPAARRPVEGFLSFGADLDMALRFLHRGATVTAEFIDREVHEFRPLLHQLARALGHPVGDSAYRIDMLAGPSGLCTEMHTDADYAINLQIFGGKKWRLMRNSLSHPPDGCNDEDTPIDVIRVAPDRQIPTRIAGEVNAFSTEPGSAVWRQSGVWHETDNTGDELNLSLVFTLYGRGRNRDFSARLVDFLHRWPEWRAPMFGAHGQLAHQAAYRERIADLVAETFLGAQGATAADAYYNLPLSISSRYRFRPMSGVEVRGATDDNGVHVLEIETRDTIGELELKGDVDTLTDLVTWSLAQTEGFSGADAVGHAETSDKGPGVHADDVARLLDGLCAIGAVVREEKSLFA